MVAYPTIAMSLLMPKYIKRIKPARYDYLIRHHLNLTRKLSSLCASNGVAEAIRISRNFERKPPNIRPIVF